MKLIGIAAVLWQVTSVDDVLLQWFDIFYNWLEWVLSMMRRVDIKGH